MSTYTYDTFLNQYTDTDSTLQIVDTDGVVKFTINPYSILTTMISNNLVTFKIKSGRLISIPFSTMNESKMSLILVEERIQLLINKIPNFIDKQVEKYVYINGGVTGSTGATGLGATGATGATGPAVNISGTPLNIPMFDLSGSSLTASIISQGDGYVEIDSLTMSTSGLRFKNLKSISLPTRPLTLDEDGNVILHDDIILTSENFKTVNGQSIVGTGNIDTTLINPDNILPATQIVDLVQSNSLVPGNYYMINDYQTIYKINGSDSAIKVFNKKITSFVSNTWGVLEGGYDYNLIVNKAVTITKLPDGYSGGLVVGGTTTIKSTSSYYYFKFNNGMENVLNLEFSYDMPRFSNGIADNIIVNDANGKPVIKPGGVLNIEVHDGTAYMDMTSQQNLSVPVESLILRAKSTNEFELEGKSATYADDVIEFRLPETGSISTKGTILRRYNNKLNIDLPLDWRIQRYRRWRIDSASILKILNQDLTSSTVTFNAGIAQFTANNSTTATPNRYYIASDLDSPAITLDTNGKIIDFTLTVDTQISAIDFHVFNLDANHYPTNVEICKVSDKFDNTIIQDNLGELNYKTRVDVQELTNCTFVCSANIVGSFPIIRDSLFLDTFQITPETKASIIIKKMKVLALTIIAEGSSSVIDKMITSITMSNYGGTPNANVRWCYINKIVASSLENVVLGCALTRFYFINSKILDCTLFFHTNRFSATIGSRYQEAIVSFNNCVLFYKTILNRAKMSNAVFDACFSYPDAIPANVAQRDVYINTTNYENLTIKMNNFNKKLYYLDVNVSDVISVNTFAIVQP